MNSPKTPDSIGLQSGHTFNTRQVTPSHLGYWSMQGIDLGIYLLMSDIDIPAYGNPLYWSVSCTSFDSRERCALLRDGHSSTIGERMADNLKIRQPLDGKNNQCEGVAASAWLVTRGVGFRSRVGSHLHLADRARREQSFSSGAAEDFSDIES